MNKYFAVLLAGMLMLAGHAVSQEAAEQTQTSTMAQDSAEQTQTSTMAQDSADQTQTTAMPKEALLLAQVTSNVTAEPSSVTLDQSTPQTRVIPSEYAENYAFTNPNERQTFLKLTEQLRCPKCQNQNIADSDAPIAHDMRRKVYQLMKEGNDEEQVVDWMKARYGDFVHYQPPVNALTMWLWLAPVMFAFIMLIVFIKRRKAVDETDLEARLARADKLLKEG